MKKIYFSAVLLFGFTNVFSQKNMQDSRVYHPTKQGASKSIKTAKNELKIEGDTIFHETFSSIGNWTTSDQDGAVWLHDLDGPSGQFSATDDGDIIESTTVGDGFMIFDADAANVADPYTNKIGSLVSPAIDLSTSPNVSLTFEQNYRTCCSRDFYPKVEVSTDDFTTFTEFDVTTFGVEVNDLSGTTTTLINLSEYTATATNLTNFKLRFNFDGGVGQTHYFWQVDDVLIIEQFAVDFAINRAWLGDIITDFEVTETPVSQAGNLTVQAAVEKLGFQNPTNTRLQVYVFDENMDTVATEIGGTLSNNFTAFYDTITFNTSIDLANFAIGAYTVEMTLLMDEVDGILANNVFTRTLVISENTLSSINFDELFYRESIAWDYRDADTDFTTSMEVGSIFTINEDILISGLDIALSTSTTYPTSNDEELNLRIYEYLPEEENSFVQVYGDYGYIVESGMYSSNVDYYTFNFYNSNNTSSLPVQLLAGKQYVATFSHYGGPEKYMWYWTGRNDDDFSSFVNGPFGAASAVNWFVAGYDPAIKMNFDQTLNVNKINQDLFNVNVAPNPFTKEAAILYSVRSEQKMNIEIFDMQGKQLAQKVVIAKNGHNTFDLSSLSLAKGMYQAIVSGNNAHQQVKFVVQ